MQSKHGLDGQRNACCSHKITKTEIKLICSGGFLVSVIHGRHDVIAQICHARSLAQRLYPVARMVDLHGGHLVSHERTEEEWHCYNREQIFLALEEIASDQIRVNKSLLELVNASAMKKKLTDWTNLTMENSGYFKRRITLIRQECCFSYIFHGGKVLVLSTFPLRASGFLALEYGRRALVVKPVKVGPSRT